MGHAARQPVYLTCGDENPNAAAVLMLVLGARPRPADFGGFERVCVMFEGGDPAAVAAARQDWQAVTDARLTARYWAQEDARWVERARS